MFSPDTIKDILITVFLPSGVARVIDAEKRTDKAMDQLREEHAKHTKAEKQEAIIEAGDHAIEELLQGFENNE